MQIVLMASGTRGDVQPMIALGIGLRAAGHAVRVVAGSNFMPWITAHGLEAFPTVDMEAIMRSDLGIRWAEGPSPLAQLRTMRSILHGMRERTIADALAGTAGADLVLAGFVAEPFAQAICERHAIPQITVALQPYRATRSGAASLVPVLPRSESVLNRWMGIVAERMSWSVAADVVNQLRASLGLGLQTATTYRRAAQAIPALYAFSPAVVPPIADAQAHTTGYWFLAEPEPSLELQRFVADGDPPVYIGFGSMPSGDPGASLKLMIEALGRVGRRGVLARGWSGTGAVPVPASILVVDHAPQRWLFGRMAALVHHGGAGTTAAGLWAGKPALIVPHLGDQPYWGRRVHALGVGVRPLPRTRLTADALAGRLATLLADPLPARNAARLGERIRAEDGVGSALRRIKQLVG